MKTGCMAVATALAGAALAGVPLAWEARPGNPRPVTFDRFHGETLDLAVTLEGFGGEPFGQSADVRLWYQTNGMGASWWSAPATVSSNVVRATWTQAMDAGADRVSLFLGAPSRVYAAAVLLLRHSPGFAPYPLPDPDTFHETDPVFAAWLDGWTPPVTDLTPATNYTDEVAGEFEDGTRTARNALTLDGFRVYDIMGMAQNLVYDAAQAATNYTDAATNALAHALGPGGGGGGPSDRLTDGTNIVTAAREVYEVVSEQRYTDWTWTSEPETGIIISNIRWEGYAEPDTYILLFDASTESGHGGPDYEVVGRENADELYYVGNFGDPDVGIGWTITFRRQTYPVQVTNYVGKVALTNDLPAASAPGAPEVCAALRWKADGTACVVTVGAGGTLAADLAGWTEGQAVLAVITLDAGAVIGSGIELVGYGDWPRGVAFVACCYRVGQTVFVVPSATL